MSTVSFAVSPASLQGPLCNPQKGSDWGWCPAATQRDGARDVVRCKESWRILQTHTLQVLIAKVLQGMKSLRGWVSCS